MNEVNSKAIILYNEQHILGKFDISIVFCIQNTSVLLKNFFDIWQFYGTKSHDRAERNKDIGVNTKFPTKIKQKYITYIHSYIINKY